MSSERCASSSERFECVEPLFLLASLMSDKASSRGFYLDFSLEGRIVNLFRKLEV